MMSNVESEPIIQSEEIPEDDVDEEVQNVLKEKFSDRVPEHSLENLDIDRLLVERLGEFGWYQKVKIFTIFPKYDFLPLPFRSATCLCVCLLL